MKSEREIIEALETVDMSECADLVESMAQAQARYLLEWVLGRDDTFQTLFLNPTRKRIAAEQTQTSISA
jgi:hypothetical protein